METIYVVFLPNFPYLPYTLLIPRARKSLKQISYKPLFLGDNGGECGAGGLWCFYCTAKKLQRNLWVKMLNKITNSTGRGWGALEGAWETETLQRDFSRKCSSRTQASQWSRAQPESQRKTNSWDLCLLFPHACSSCCGFGFLDSQF